MTGTTLTVDGVVSDATGAGSAGHRHSGFERQRQHGWPASRHGHGNGATTPVLATGTLILNNTGNTYTGGTILDSGILQLTVNNLAVLGTGGLTLNGGTFQWNGVTTDISSRTVTLASGGGTLDVDGTTVTLANPIGNGGSGALTVMSSAANGVLNLSAANTYTGGTMITNVTLLANNTSGSATGTNTVIVAGGGTLAGDGIISGAVTVDSGGILAPAIRRARSPSAIT